MIPPAPPCPAPDRWWRMWVSGLHLCWQLQLSACSLCVYVFPHSYAALWDSKSPHRSACERVSCSSFTTPSPGQVSIPNSFVFLFVFYILSYLLSKRMGSLSKCLVSFSSIQKLFCGSFSAFKWSFDEFVGKKVVSRSYSSAILGPDLNSFSSSPPFSLWWFWLKDYQFHLRFQTTSFWCH